MSKAMAEENIEDKAAYLENIPLDVCVFMHNVC